MVFDRKCRGGCGLQGVACVAYRAIGYRVSWGVLN